MAATNAGDVEAVKVLLSANKGFRGASTPLIRACLGAHVEVVRLFLADPCLDPNVANEHGNTALMVAARYGHGNIVQLLLDDKRVDPCVAKSDGDTALTFACDRGHPRVVEQLLRDERITPNDERNARGNSPLMIAAGRGHVAVVRLLLSDGRADPNTVNLRGHTALISAAMHKHVDVCALLVADARTDRTPPPADQVEGRLIIDRVVAAHTRRVWLLRFRGVVRAVVVLRRMRARAAERVYAPYAGREGYAAAASHFHRLSQPQGQSFI